MAVNIARVAKLYSEYQVEARRFMGACVKNVYIKVEVKNATIPKRISTKITNTEMISCTGKSQGFMPLLTTRVTNRIQAIIAAR